MLTAKQLVRAMKEPRQAAEEKRDVTKCLERTASSEVEVEERISSLFQSLASPRVAVRSSLNLAEWDEERGQVIITRNCGRQDIGPLNPEEALFLLENNSLHLTRSEVPLSLQAAYTLLLGHTDLTLGNPSNTTVIRQTFYFTDKYLVYSKLTREGFKLVRTNPENISKDNSDESEDEIDADIEMNMIEPLYGEELVAENQWLVGLIADIVAKVVSSAAGGSVGPGDAGGSGGQRKRKLDSSPDRTSKQIRRDNTTSDDDQEESESDDDGTDNSRSPKRYKNPFHEDTSDDEIEIEKTVTFSRKRRNKRLQEPVKKPTMQNIHEVNSKIYSSIRCQVEEAEKRKSSKVFEGSRSLFFCEICKVSCDTEEILKIHKSGKNHKKKSSGTNKKHSCEICHIECTDANSLVMHLKGKKHLKVMSSLVRSFVPTSTQQSENSSEVLILTDERTEGDVDEEEIEIIEPDKSREEILAGIPNCSRTGTIRWNSQDIYSLVPTNTIKPQNKVSSLDVAKFFQGNNEKRRRGKEVTRVSVRIEDEVIVLDDESPGLTRPYRGFYPDQESGKSGVRGHSAWSMRGKDKVDYTGARMEEENLDSLTRRAVEWTRQISNERVDVVDLGSSSSEDEDSSRRTSDQDESSMSSSEYSDDVSAHSELRHFKTGPLASLWTFENKVGPLICPDMAGSIREIFGRIQMDPLERNYTISELEEDLLEVTFDVYLAEHFKKNTNKSPSYRVVIQDSNASLPSPRALCDLDQRYPDSVPFLFAIVSAGTVCFFNMERIELRSYYKDM